MTMREMVEIHHGWKIGNYCPCHLAAAGKLENER